MVVLLTFPIDREKAVRLGAAARWQDWPLHQGGLVAPGESFLIGERAGETLLPRGHSLMDEARAENERLKELVAVEGVATFDPATLPWSVVDIPGLEMPLPPLEDMFFVDYERTPCASLDAAMIDHGLGQRRTGREPSFHFGGIQLDVGPIVRADNLKVMAGRIWRWLVHFFNPLLHRGGASRGILQAQPGLRHGNQSPDFPAARPDDLGGGAHE